MKECRNECGVTRFSIPAALAGDFRGSLQHLRRELECLYVEVCVLRRLSEREKSEIWDRFEGGESLRSISPRLKRPPSTIRTHIVSAGLRRPLPSRDWSPLRLLLTEREEISRGLTTGETLRCIAVRLERAPSTVSGEVGC